MDSKADLINHQTMSVELRKKLHLTQTQLAQLLGFQRSAISHVETGRSRFCKQYEEKFLALWRTNKTEGDDMTEPVTQPLAKVIELTAQQWSTVLRLLGRRWHTFNKPLKIRLSKSITYLRGQDESVTVHFPEKESRGCATIRECIEQAVQQQEIPPARPDGPAETRETAEPAASDPSSRPEEDEYSGFDPTPSDGALVRMVNGWPLVTEQNGTEYRVSATVLGRKFGQSNRQVIIRLIDRNRPELERYGEIDVKAIVTTTSMPQGGSRSTVVDEPFLNEHQAVLLAMKAEGPIPEGARYSLIMAYEIVKRGTGAPGNRDLDKFLQMMLEDRKEAREERKELFEMVKTVVVGSTAQTTATKEAAKEAAVEAVKPVVEEVKQQLDDMGKKIDDIAEGQQKESERRDLEFIYRMNQRFGLHSRGARHGPIAAGSKREWKTVNTGTLLQMRLRRDFEWRPHNDNLDAEYAELEKDIEVWVELCATCKFEYTKWIPDHLGHTRHGCNSDWQEVDLRKRLEAVHSNCSKQQIEALELKAYTQRSAAYPHEWIAQHMPGANGPPPSPTPDPVPEDAPRRPQPPRGMPTPKYYKR